MAPRSSKPVLVSEWLSYYLRLDTQKPSSLAEWVARSVTGKTEGIDLGSGNCRDSKLYLARGVVRKMTAYDSSPDTKSFVGNMKKEFPERFLFKRTPFHKIVFKRRSCDLFHANAAFPFYGRDGYDKFVHSAIRSVRPGGIFAASFLGTHHRVCAAYPNVVSKDRAELEKDFQGLSFEIRPVDNEDHRGRNHYFNVLVRI